MMNIKHNRYKVLELGTQLFWSQGYHNLGVDKICKTTGMTKGAFYNAFKSKENFLLSCIESYGYMNVNLLTKELNSKEKAIDRILNMYINMFKNQPNMNYIGCMTNNIMSEVGAANEVVRQATAVSFENLLNVIQPAVQEAQDDGDISSAISAKDIAELLHTTFFGALTRAKSSKDFKTGINTMTLLIKSLKSI
ncbi:MAG: TetR/AcrR family transcriptional repressor of nem operon [Flavobacteriaceae bacterium]|jgi:TetR/AcrR family transcriptional repressor of nem operon